MKIRTEKVIDCAEWDKLVVETYGRPYRLQQQEGCRERGNIRLKVPDEAHDDEMNDEIPEIVNHETMGVKFAKWLERNPTKHLGTDANKWAIDLWWARNFYPDFQTVANDLHHRGLLEAGEYTIDIDW